MTLPSLASTMVFVALCLALVVLLAFALGKPRANEPIAHARRWRNVTLAVLAGYLAASAGISASGVLASPGVPPPLMLFFSCSLLVAVVAAFSPVGTRLLQTTPIAGLVGFQAFRLPLELVLHQWYEDGTIPIQMTYEGHNFDIITGIAALALWLWSRHSPLSRPLVWAFNGVGSALLVTVATIAALSAPVPFRMYMNDPAVLLALHAPYGWIVTVCVAGALFGHLVVFRWLWRDTTSKPGIRMQHS